MNIYEKRVRELSAAIKKEKLEALVVSRLEDVGFLTGFHLEGCLLLVGKSEVRAFTSKMLRDHVSSKVPFAETISSDNIRNSVFEFAQKKKIKKIAFEPETVSYLDGLFWKKKGFAAKGGFVSSLRQVKKEAELINVSRSCRIAAEVFPIIKKKIKKGRSEISVARQIEDLMQARGAYGPSFRIIVAFGENSALPHHETSERRLKNNETVLIDYGCVYNFYCSDMTRTFFYGRPSAEFRKVYSIVQEAQKRGIKAVKSGTRASFVDKVVREHISDNGYGQYFIHGTGHGIGLEIHESPLVNSKSKAVLKTGMCLTVEPGIYLKGKFGVRIEDSLLVGKKGSKILTKAG